MTGNDFSAIKRCVIEAAREELIPRFAAVERRQKQDGSVITEADLAVQQRIGAELQRLFPEALFLGEEMSEDEQLAALGGAAPLWCLDPLDGTSNFVNGIPFFSVSLALIEQGRVRMGLVYDPLRDECFFATENPGASLNDAPLQLADTGLPLRQCTAIVDFKRLGKNLAARLATEAPYGSQRSFGSVALDWCWLAAGRGQLYLHGRQKIWDYAAGHFIFTSAGGHAMTLEQEPVFACSLAPRSAIAAVDQALFAAWSEWLLQA